MREIMPYIWLAIIIFAATASISTRSRRPFLLVPAGITVFILSLSGTQVWRQALLFFILAPVLFILTRALLKKFKAGSLIVGTSAVVTEEINNHKDTGAIRINGRAHSARAEEHNIIYETGLVVTIISFDGPRAICSR